jgi:hypothetical protein
MRLTIRARDCFGNIRDEISVTYSNTCIEIMQRYYRDWELGFMHWVYMHLSSLDEQNRWIMELKQK